MGRDTRIQLSALVVLLASMGLCGALAPVITTSIGRNKLSFTDRAEEGQPPEIAMGIAMGAFRGVFVNYLWIRANTLKEEGKYHEAIQLSEAITKLQPRFPRVWVFHAWNMAYNISVTTQTATERWGWVNAGIKLLREKGIPANPNDMLLHKELAWIFIHKIQGYTDDANPYYKRRLAEEWHSLLGPPPYIDPREPALVALDVRTYEPHLALFAAEGGLAILARLFGLAEGLHPEAVLACEIGYGQLDAVLDLAGECPWLELVEVRSDLAGIARDVVFRRAS